MRHCQASLVDHGEKRMQQDDMQSARGQKKKQTKGMPRHGYVNFSRPKQIPQGAISPQNLTWGQLVWMGIGGAGSRLLLILWASWHRSELGGLVAAPRVFLGGTL